MEKLVKNSVKGAKVFVGLSGGVDSSVSAALLKEAGANVVGVFIKGWYPPGLPCTWADERRAAMRAAAHLSIPFTTLDASVEYKKGVIDYLLAEYGAGRTPNPDVMCNREVKFGAFYEFAMNHGADFIATGHYARSEEGKLLRGVDAEKDQSYFLWAIQKEALAKTLFPVGAMGKATVRELAKKFKLPNATKKDSQGICFLGSVSVEDFLRTEFGTEPGVAVDAKGKEVGMHNGAILSTIGERVSLSEAAAGPWYVVKKDIKANTLTVSHERVAPTIRETITLRDVNVLDDSVSPKILTAQYRYHGSRVEGSWNAATGTFTPEAGLPEPLASGQSLVLYSGNTVVLGGIIV